MLVNNKSLKRGKYQDPDNSSLGILIRGLYPLNNHIKVGLETGYFFLENYNNEYSNITGDSYYTRNYYRIYNEKVYAIPLMGLFQYNFNSLKLNPPLKKINSIPLIFKIEAVIGIHIYNSKYYFYEKVSTVKNNNKDTQITDTTEEHTEANFAIGFGPGLTIPLIYNIYFDTIIRFSIINNVTELFKEKLNDYYFTYGIGLYIQL